MTDNDNSVAVGSAAPVAVVSDVPTGRTAPSAAPEVSEAPKPVDQAEPPAQSYVWLADGRVIRVNDADLPGYAGTNALMGHWVKDGKEYLIVGVYPVENTVKG